MVGRVAYRSGFVNRLDDVGSLPVWSIDGSHLPDDVFALLDHRLLDLAGTYGDPKAGDPIRYDDDSIAWLLRAQGIETEVVVHPSR